MSTLNEAIKEDFVKTDSAMAEGPMGPSPLANPPRRADLRGLIGLRVRKPVPFRESADSPLTQETKFRFKRNRPDMAKKLQNSA